MTEEEMEVVEEAEAALCTFTEEGFADMIGFGLNEHNEVIAEVYGPEGGIERTYKLTISVEEI